MTQRTRNTGLDRWGRQLVVLVAIVGIAGAALLWRRQLAWWSPPSAAAQNLDSAAPDGMATDVPDIPAAQGNRPGARRFREPPRLLSQAEVEQGLAERHQAMRQRFLAHQDRRSQEGPEDYAIPEPPPGAARPPRPDGPGGEFRRGGGR